MSGWTPAQLAALNREMARKQRMADDGVDPADPAEREAWEDEHVREEDCVHCRKTIRRDDTEPESEQVWRDDWDDYECSDAPDGLHATLEELT